MKRTRTRIRELWKALEVIDEALEVIVANHNQLVVSLNAHRDYIVALEARIRELEAAMKTVLRDENRC